MELFVEIGLKIKNASELNHLYIVGLANDYLSYIVTQKAFEEGKMEAFSTRLSPVGGEVILNASRRLITELF